MYFTSLVSIPRVPNALMNVRRPGTALYDGRNKLNVTNPVQEAREARGCLPI